MIHLAELAFAFCAFFSAPPAAAALPAGDGYLVVRQHTAMRHVGGGVVHYQRIDRPAPRLRQSRLVPQPWLRR